MKTVHQKRLSRALVSVYDKDAVRELAGLLHSFDIEILATGGTLSAIREMGIPATAVEDLTGYPSLLGGRVKTMHPAVLGGVLCRNDLKGDRDDMHAHGLKPIDMVVVDLYPFEQTLASGASHSEIIEHIDIGGIALIRAATKNFQHVFVVPDASFFTRAVELLKEQNAHTSLHDRRRMAAAAMDISTHYDTAIFHYLNDGEHKVFKESIRESRTLRYGENPHQQAFFYGELESVFEQLGGKSLSYNNLLDVDAAMGLMLEFTEPTFAIIKHTNACGVASRIRIEDAWADALAGDPVSAFGGILIANRAIGRELAENIADLFFEVLIAPSYDEESLHCLTQKRDRIILRSKSFMMPDMRYRSLLNGVLWQTQDHKNILPDQWRRPTEHKPDKSREDDLLFANTVVKHLKSNAIVLAKDRMLLGVGTGQTSRVDALKQAVMKARAFTHDLEGAVMASDAFFPFPDCVEIAHKEGIVAVIQPGGSVKDQASVDYCDKVGMAMVFTGERHFRH